MARILLLGGSREGYNLAEILCRDNEVISSFAGATDQLREPRGPFRVGGFGGWEKLASFGVDNRIEVVIDATHPYASAMKDNVFRAARHLSIPQVHYIRAPWEATAADHWYPSATLAECATMVREGPCLLAVGRSGLSAFSERRDLQLVARVIDDPKLGLPHLTIVRDRGPFSLANDRALFKNHGIASLVCRNSGGRSAIAKLEVARELALPVYMVDRPKPPRGTIVNNIAALRRWLSTNTSINLPAAIEQLDIS